MKENHPKYSVQEIPKALVYLDVANQGENFVDCEILSGNQQGNLGPTFTIRRDKNALNCELLLSNELDYEKQTYYKLDVNVRQQRVKRQGKCRKSSAFFYMSCVMHTCDTTRQIVKLPIFRPRFRRQDIEAKNLTRKKS